MEYIYHYTSGNYLEKIFQDEKLIVSQWEKKNNVKPAALWFSKNPVWEPTARKEVDDNGRRRLLTMEETHQRLGLFRFVISFNKERLCNWNAYKYKVNAPAEEQIGMERLGIEWGANPDDWYASFGDIPLADCIACEKWNGSEWELYKDFKQIQSNPEGSLI